MNSHPQSTQPSHLDLTQDVAQLTAQLIDIESVSGNEKVIADLVESSLRALGHLEVVRDGDTVMARTRLNRGERVILAGHLDTVPLPEPAPEGGEPRRGTVPSEWVGETLYGRGATDMKGGVAVQLAIAATVKEPVRDITFIFYDHEEVEASLSGLGRVARNFPEWLKADFAVLLEPTNGDVEGGCNGTTRFVARTHGVRAHSARAWRGKNAIHGAGEILRRLAEHEPLTRTVEGLEYRESLNAVRITGGVAGNVIPDACEIEINYRFAPSLSVDDAEAYVRELLDGFEVVRTDAASGARPGLDRPAAAAFVAAVGFQPKPKYGWTDVARFSELGVPAVNFGPGDSLLAHTDDENVKAADIQECLAALTRWLAS
ncbi:succinyl-diaminopimelate desuccinylase [Neomicrococcus aestuarii]|uniref:Succinyl-diaminopimelate desuccinylase n=1 Tax=Neomicrococcus aestuarii TaxID=556325 RepID=A0A1L2ZQC2_9MICC|nr:succinyl-diaminopimelate desuccinylase [Neomicrococcus aestuarii]APF41584.1 succinyl-diaminopimelate desuccinylase [Neomicrococcus aestuarii]